MQKPRTRKKKNNSSKGVELIDRIQSWIFMVVLALLPLLVRAKVYYFIAPEISISYLNTGSVVDIFYYYKFVFLIVATILSIILLLIKIFVYGYTIRPSYINISLMVLTAVTLVTGLTAEYLSISVFGGRRFEGALTYFCYFTFLFVAANTNFRKTIGNYATAALGIIICMNAVIVLFNFYDRNLSDMDFIKSIIYGVSVPIERLTNGNFTTTLANRNYLSGLTGATTAFFIMLTLLKTNIKTRLLCGFLSVVSFIAELASLSSSGFLSLLVVLPVIAFIAMFRNKDRLKTLGAAGLLFVAFGLAFWGMNSYNDLVSTEALGPLLAAGNIIDSVSTGEELSQDTSVNTGGGRTYIWEKTLELISKKPVLGYGHDTLPYYFPQYDPQKVFPALIIVDKPHNMYLETIYGSGVFALIALLVLLLQHSFHTVKVLLRGLGHHDMVIPSAFFVFWCAYLLQWLFNDSIIGSSPVFWILFGMAVSLNIEHEERVGELA